MIAYYGNVRIEGPKDQVEFILRLIQDSHAKQIRKSAIINIGDTN